MKSPDPLITLTTDFGEGSPYVAAMKGVILSVNPAVRLIDITHSVRPRYIRQGARILAETTPLFPAGTIHLAVVDPGVGSQRRIIYAHIGDQRYVAPDNGLLGDLAQAVLPSKIVSITEREFWRPQVSPTFHGRDIMAPVAAHLSLGVRPERLGPAVDEALALDRPEVKILANQIQGEVASVDSFGNLITNITAEMLEGAPVDDRTGVFCDEHETRGIFTTYSDQPEMTLIALVGSSGFLELAIVGESAAMMLGVTEGTGVTVKW